MTKHNLVTYINKIIEDLEKTGVKAVEFDIGINNHLEIDNFSNNRIKFEVLIK